VNLTRSAAARLSPDARRRVRRLTDGVLSPIGSLREVRTDQPLVALTYDDGPKPGDTDAVLAALASAGAKATFFQLVERAERYPALVRDIVDAGHEVALHGIDHCRLTTLPAITVHRLLVDGKRRLEDVAGTTVSLFRPAYGAQSLRTLVAARLAGLDVVVWGPSAEDWRDGSVSDVAERALVGTGPGVIMLLHDGFEVPVGDPLPRPTLDRGKLCRELLIGLEERGYAATSVSRLLAHGKFHRTAWFRP